MLEEFLKTHSHLRIKFSYHRAKGNYWMVQIFNTTFDLGTPIFEYKMTAEELDQLNVDFETALMTPVVNWWDNRHEKEEL